MMSILRSLDDRADGRRVCLVYASRAWEEVTFREELSDLEKRLNLEVHHVLSRPDACWRGFRGRLNQSMVRQCLKSLRPPFNVFVCGSPGMVDTATSAVSGLGVPASWLHAETFASV
jgi:3-phenylpropionate/trans-cinnamate dioxygenase ferredoxin reductase subunit